MPSKLFVANLPYEATARDLHEYFSQFGEIEKCVVIVDQETQKSKGFGFVTFTPHSTTATVAKEQCDGAEWKGRKLRVEFAVSRKIKEKV